MDNRSRKLWRSGLSIVVLIAIMVAIEVKAPGTMKRVIVDDVEVTIRSLMSHHPEVAKKVHARPRQLSEDEKLSLAFDTASLSFPPNSDKHTHAMVQGFLTSSEGVKSAATVVDVHTNWGGVTTIVYYLPFGNREHDFISSKKPCYRNVHVGDKIAFKAVYPRPVPKCDDLGNWLEVTVVKPAQSPTMRAIEIQNKRWAQEKRRSESRK